MRIYKTIITGILITITAVAYVHQQFEIIKMGYTLQKNRKYLSFLVDQNSNLMYDLSKLESPRALLASLTDEDMEFTRNRSRQANIYQVALATPVEEGSEEGVISRFMDIFTVDAEAKSGK